MYTTCNLGFHQTRVNYYYMKKNLHGNELWGLWLVVRAQHVMLRLEACHGSEICRRQSVVFTWRRVKRSTIIYRVSNLAPLDLDFFVIKVKKKHKWDVEAGQQRYVEIPLFMIILERSIIVLLDGKIINLLVVFPHPFISVLIKYLNCRFT